jgi:hypothetical protein
MRGALLEHPKVITMAEILSEDRKFRDWLHPGCMSECVVSDDALRCVTVALLLRVWSGARSHGYFDGDDLVLPYSAIAHLDQMACAPGVGEAMQLVDWASGSNDALGIRLDDFKTYNAPMTNAEKQAAYRKRKEGVTDPLPDTSNNAVTREEKSREESKTPHKPPKGGEVFHEDTDYVCDYFDTGLRFWRPKATNKPRSIQNRRAVSKLLSDHADRERVVSVISFLFGACSPDPQSYDYRPEDNGKFDWRVNCQSPKKLLKHWDALDALFQAAYDKAVAGV